jgi:hypothetical protein
VARRGVSHARTPAGARAARLARSALHAPCEHAATALLAAVARRLICCHTAPWQFVEMKGDKNFKNACDGP